MCLRTPLLLYMCQHCYVYSMLRYTTMCPHCYVSSLLRVFHATTYCNICVLTPTPSSSGARTACTCGPRNSAIPPQQHSRGRPGMQHRARPRKKKKTLCYLYRPHAAAVYLASSCSHTAISVASACSHKLMLLYLSRPRTAVYISYISTAIYISYMSSNCYISGAPLVLLYIADQLVLLRARSRTP
jgi:hypothetical protein